MKRIVRDGFLQLFKASLSADESSLSEEAPEYQAQGRRL